MKASSLVLCWLLINAASTKAEDFFLGIESWILTPGIGLYYTVSDQKLTVTEIHDFIAEPKVAFVADLPQSQLQAFVKTLGLAKKQIEFGKAIELKGADGGHLLRFRRHPKSRDDVELFEIQNLLIPEVLAITELIDSIVPEKYEINYSGDTSTDENTRVRSLGPN
ncbi:MAG: hypothetical protein MI807_10420 [Verrucomicrobiales bacterium]|nr:hypothetical protein [Verrucomicrobiales bacterium]